MFGQRTKADQGPTFSTAFALRASPFAVGRAARGQAWRQRQQALTGGRENALVEREKRDPAQAGQREMRRGKPGLPPGRPDAPGPAVRVTGRGVTGQPANQTIV